MYLHFLVVLLPTVTLLFRYFNFISVISVADMFINEAYASQFSFVYKSGAARTCVCLYYCSGYCSQRGVL